MNVVTGCFYVGSTLYLNRRALAHKGKLASGKHHNKHLQSSYKKHGASNFLFLPILFNDWETCKKVEQSCLDSNIGNPACYNIAIFIDSGTKGRRHSNETRAKIGAANSIALIGHSLSPAHRKKLSEALKLAYAKNPRVISEEAKRKMSAAKMGQRMPWNEAPKTDLAKRRISETKLGFNFIDVDWPVYMGLSEQRKKQFLKQRGYR